MTVTYNHIFVEHAHEQHGTEIILELGFTYTPGRPATPPSYSHGGLPPDPEENLLEAVFIKGMKHVPENDLFDLMYNECKGETWFTAMEEKYLEEVARKYVENNEPDPDAERDRWQDQQERQHRKEQDGEDWH